MCRERGDVFVERGFAYVFHADIFIPFFVGKLKPTMAFMSGKLRIKGNMSLALRLEKLVSQLGSKL